MDLSHFSPSHTVEPGRPLRLENSRGSRIAVLEGNVWITQDRDPRDVVIGAGGDFLLDRPGLAVVTALDGNARIARLEG